MSFLEGLAAWFLQQLLSYLFNKATQAVEDAQDQLKKDATNAANQKAYDEAKDRASRIDAANALLNGTSPP